MLKKSWNFYVMWAKTYENLDSVGLHAKYSMEFSCQLGKYTPWTRFPKAASKR